MSISHSKNTVFKLDDLAGALQTVSSYFRSASGFLGKADQPDTSAFGDNATRRGGATGLRDGGPIQLGGLWKATTAASHGKIARMVVDQYALVGKTRKASLKRMVALPDTQQWGATWKERGAVGRLSCSGSIAGLFNDAAGELGAILESLFLRDDTPAVFSLAYRGFTIGNLVDLFKGAITSYPITSPEDGLCEASADFDGDDQADLGVSLHDLVEETGAAPINGASVDETAASAAGGVGHLHMTAFNGTTATIKIQHSTDDAAWVDLISFTAMTAVGVQRIEVSGTVNRYVRAIVSAGTYTAFTFVVAFARRGFAYGTAGTFRHLAGLYGKELTSSFEYGPGGSTAGKKKYSGECRLSELSVDLAHDDLLKFSSSLVVDGAITPGTF